MKPVFKQIILFGIILIGVFSFYLGLFPDSISPVVGKTLPKTELQSTTGQTINTKDLYKDKVILLNFWATWCPPCRDEIPLLNTIHGKFYHNNFQIIAVMEDEAKDLADRNQILNSFQKKIPIQFPVFFDPNTKLADALNTFKLPETYLINQKGKIVYKHDGPLNPWDVKKIEGKISELLK